MKIEICECGHERIMHELSGECLEDVETTDGDEQCPCAEYRQRADPDEP